MGRQDEFTKERIKKIDELRKLGINPYPVRYDVKNHSAELQEKYKSLKPEATTKDSVKVAGRLISVRDLGKIAFAVLQDGQGKIQLTFQEKETSDKIFEFFKKFIDSGDFIGVEGTIFRTKRGELSILVKKLELLSKSILPLPEKFHGLQDEEERLRKRYLEIITNPEVRERFIRKSKFWQSIRNFLLEKGFLEVETPIIESTPGGAEAKPFITHHNALDLPVSLRISDELWLKRLLVAGYPKVFEIGRIFRNEGMDAEHLQDYTQMEFYWAYADFNDGMKLVEEMYKKIAKEVYGTLKFKIKEFDIDFGKKWEIYDYVAIIKKMTGINILKTSLKEIESKLGELNVEYDQKGFNLNRAIDNLWKYCRKKIAGPGFLINVPVFMEPLAKRSEKNPDVVERYQVMIAGSEIGKGFSELNDPMDQRGRFEEQAKLREAGDEEAQRMDYDFVEALEYGMPPTTGFGISERLFSFLEDKPIRECVIFPLMRPLGVKVAESGKSKETKIAAVVINKSLKLKPWEEMSTIAHLNAAFGARKGRQLLSQDSISTKDNEQIKLNIQHAIMIKEANSNKDIIGLIKKAKENNLEIAEFTREMIETTNDKKIIDITEKKNLNEVEYLGVLIFGNKALVDKLADKFKLYK